MYSALLTTHSLFRWLVLLSLLFAIYRSFRGWFGEKEFSAFDNTTRHWTATTAHIQLTIGVWLYFISPIVEYFLHNFGEAVHMREIRFFGMEHSSMMFIGILIVTIGSMKAKRKASDKEKFKTMAIWYSIGLLIILANIPWSFSPLISRPDYRLF